MKYTREQFRNALVIVEAYCDQIIKARQGKQINEVGCVVKLSSWGLEMQGKRKHVLKGTVVDWLDGYTKSLRDGTVCVKWDGKKKPEWMHSSHLDRCIAECEKLIKKEMI